MEVFPPQGQDRITLPLIRHIYAKFSDDFRLNRDLITALADTDEASRYKELKGFATTISRSAGSVIQPLLRLLSRPHHTSGKVRVAVLSPDQLRDSTVPGTPFKESDLEFVQKCDEDLAAAQRIDELFRRYIFKEHEGSWPCSEPPSLPLDPRREAILMWNGLRRVSYSMVSKSFQSPPLHAWDEETGTVTTTVYMVPETSFSIKFGTSGNESPVVKALKSKDVLQELTSSIHRCILNQHLSEIGDPRFVSAVATGDLAKLAEWRSKVDAMVRMHLASLDPNRDTSRDPAIVSFASGHEKTLEVQNLTEPPVTTIIIPCVPGEDHSRATE